MRLVPRNLLIFSFRLLAAATINQLHYQIHHFVQNPDSPFRTKCFSFFSSLLFSHSAMSNLEELKDALRDTLAARGSLGQIQARVRAEIFSALEETVSLADPNIYPDYRPP
jgi:hypothetical protein